MTTITPLPGTQNPWEHPLIEGTPAPVSERLIRALDAHIAAESEDAARASQLAAFTGADETLGKLRALIRNEQEGAHYLRHLARQDSDLYSGFFALLLDTFARNAEKHVHLLRYVLRHAEAQ